MLFLLRRPAGRTVRLWPLVFAIMIVLPLSVGAPGARSAADPVITAISAGNFHTCAVTSTGGVKCWGSNEHGELGDGTTEYRSTPVDVVGLTSGAVAVSTGGTDGMWNHSCALLATGVVKCWGGNQNGELGDGTTTERHTPVKVHGLPDGAVAVSAGAEYSCAVTTTGAAKCWGWNDSGQLGDGTTNSRLTAVGVVGLGSGVESISAARGANDGHTCVVTTSGAAKCWGANYSGELGTGAPSDPVLTPVDVVGLGSGVSTFKVGWGKNCFVTDAGAAKCWGANPYGALGDGTDTDRLVPTDVYGLSSGIAKIDTDWFHSCALTTAGGVKCWGYGIYGELGNGTNGVELTPVDVSGLASGVAAISVGAYHSCALSTAGEMSCWGYNYYGELGDGTTTDRSAPVPVRWAPFATVTLTKHLVPTSDPGRFDLKVGETVVKASAGNNGSGSTEVDPGTYTLSEVAAAGTNAANYASAIACTLNGNPGPSGSGTSLQVTLKGSDVLACMVTNTRKATVTLSKHLVPTSDAGRFDLKAGETVVKASAGEAGSGTTLIAPGTYTVQEAAAAGTSLADYTSSIACTLNGTPGPSASGTSVQVTLAPKDVLNCTLTNTRKATVTVSKQLVPSSDAGRFDLKLAGALVRAGAGNGDSGSRQVLPGTYRVSESGASGTSLSGYASSIACTLNGGPGPAAGGTTHLDVTVAAGDVVACTLTNRRKAQITVVKHLVPASDTGLFDLKVGGTVVKAGAEDGGSGSRLVGAGTYAVSEVAGPGTSMANYTSSIACTRNGGPGPAGGGTSLNVNAAWGDVLVCTFSNERR